MGLLFSNRAARRNMEDFVITWSIFFLSIISAGAVLCNAPDACGNYGICNPGNGNCSCPVTFVPKFAANISGGCNPGTGYTDDFFMLTGVTYSTYQDTDLVTYNTTSSKCESSCGVNPHCGAAFYDGSGKCVMMLSQIGSLLSTFDQTNVVFLWVGGVHKDDAFLSNKAIAGIVVGAFLFVVFAVLAVIFLLRNKKPHTDVETPKVETTRLDDDATPDIPRKTCWFFSSSKSALPCFNMVTTKEDKPRPGIPQITSEISQTTEENVQEEDCGQNVTLGPKTYSYAEIIEMTKNFRHKIGEGGFADVYKAWMKEGSDAAIKVFKPASNSRSREFMREISVLSMIHHWNLVEFIGYCNEKSHRILVYEYMVNGSLDNWIFNNINRPLSWEKRFNIITGVASGIIYLHDQCRNRVLHLDLKPQNILLDARFDPKVADFGLSRLLERDQAMTMTQTIRGTPHYIAPECFMGAGLNEKMDVYSFGIILLEIIAGQGIADIPGSELANALGMCEREDFFPYDIVDRAIQNSVDKTEAKRVMQVAFLCVQLAPSERPCMSVVSQMLQGTVPLQHMPFPQQQMLRDCFISKQAGGSRSFISTASSPSIPDTSAASSTQGPFSALRGR